MPNEEFCYYVKLLREFLDQDIIKIDWGKNNQGIQYSTTVEEKLQNAKYPITKDDFAHVSFEIIYISIAISQQTKKLDELDESKVSLVKEHFLTDELKDDIIIKTSGSFQVLEEIDYQILTKRNKEEPQNILTHTILLEVLSSDPQLSMEDNKYLRNMNIEISQKELENMVTVLTGILKNVERLNGE